MPQEGGERKSRQCRCSPMPPPSSCSQFSSASGRPVREERIRREIRAPREHRETRDHREHQDVREMRELFDRYVSPRSISRPPSSVASSRYGNSYRSVSTSPPSSLEILRRMGARVYDHDELGSGHYSKVYKMNLNGVKQLAVKVINLKDVGEEFRSRFLPREIMCWTEAKHRNIVNFYHNVQYKDIYLYMFIEYCQRGDLLAFIQKNGPLSDLTGRYWLSDILDALLYLHKKEIAHRDIKAENILITDKFVAKLTDFGFACMQSKNFLSRTYCGSRAYSSPQILAGKPYDVFKADSWSFGVLCYVAMTNMMPFQENVAHNSIIIEQQKQRGYPWPKFVDQECRGSVDALLTFAESERPRLATARRMPFFERRDSRPKVRSTQEVSEPLSAATVYG